MVQVDDEALGTRNRGRRVEVVKGLFFFVLLEADYGVDGLDLVLGHTPGRAQEPETAAAR